jgi:hypothetical protein
VGFDMGTHESQHAMRARKAIRAAVLAGGMLIAAPGGIAIAAADTGPGSATTGPAVRQPIVFHIKVVPGTIKFDPPKVVPGSIKFDPPKVVGGTITIDPPSRLHPPKSPTTVTSP